MTKPRSIDPAWWDRGTWKGRPVREYLADHAIGMVFRFLHGRGWSYAAIADATGLGAGRVSEIANHNRAVTSYHDLSWDSGMAMAMPDTVEATRRTITCWRILCSAVRLSARWQAPQSEPSLTACNAGCRTCQRQPHLRRSPARRWLRCAPSRSYIGRCRRPAAAAHAASQRWGTCPGPAECSWPSSPATRLGTASRRLLPTCITSWAGSATTWIGMPMPGAI